jgi:septal ring factor EnvC (AmiA/AmiB activator)
MRIGASWTLMAAACACLALASAPAVAQDVRGLEVCTAEKQMERRTGCLQANVEFLQQRLNKVALEAQQRQAAGERELNAAKAQLASATREIAALKEALSRLQTRVEGLRKAGGEGK